MVKAYNKNMVAKKYKLPIQSFLAKKPKVTGKTDFFMIRQLPNNFDYSRFGVVISKKVSPSAVVRNKIKRIIFDFIRLNKFYNKVGKDILLTVTFQIKKGEEVDKNAVESNLSKTLTKI